MIAFFTFLDLPCQFVKRFSFISKLFCSCMQQCPCLMFSLPNLFCQSIVFTISNHFFVQLVFGTVIFVYYYGITFCIFGLSLDSELFNCCCHDFPANMLSHALHVWSFINYFRAYLS
ncbi:hypothetical protein ACJX0J_030201 [Zea mays]